MKYCKNKLLNLLGMSLGAILISGSACAQSGIEEFAFQSRLSESAQALQRVELPLEVLLSLTRNDLGDVAVFDAGGQPLPSWVRKKPAQTVSKKVELAFQSFTTFRNTHSKTVSTRRIQNLDNQTSEMQTIETVPMLNRLQDYIIELSEKQQQSGIKRIRLAWTHEPADQMLKLRVEVANDLDHWKTVHSSKSLTNRDTSKPEWSQIESIPSGYQYIRLTSLKPVETFELLQATAEYDYQQLDEPIWHTLGALQRDQKQAGFYSFSLPSGLRARQMRLDPVKQQVLIKGDVYASRSDFEHKVLLKKDWRQHSFNNSSEVKDSKPFQLGSQNYTHWWFYTDQGLEPLPQVQVAFPVYELLFLGNNNDPFSLAWGNYAASAPENDLKKILGKINPATRVKQVSLTTIQAAGGDSRLTPETGKPWLKWILWLLLLLAVLVTGRMAFSLYRDMNAAQ